MTINEIVYDIVSRVNSGWSNLYKIRFVYIELGKKLQKNTDFFFSVDKKLREKNLTIDEIEKIYNANKASDDFKVICRSAAYMLKRIYDEIGIDSELIQSNNNVIKYTEDGKNLFIHHWFLSVKDEEKNYFLTLASDLPFIQMGMQTRHFGSNIPYKKIQKDGKEIQVYNGSEICHTVLSDEELRKIDIDIGYIRNIYNFDENYRKTKKSNYNYNDAALALLTQELKNNKLYIELEEQSTSFYNLLITIDNNKQEKEYIYNLSINEVKEIDWSNWIKRMCKCVQKRVEQIIQYKIFLNIDFNDDSWNFENWIKEVCLQIQRYFYQYIDNPDDSLYIRDDFMYSKWSRRIKKAIEEKYNELEIDNVLMILDKCNILASSLINKVPNPNFMKIFNSLSYHFINKNNIFETSLNNGVASTRYIAYKFKKLFKKIFSCNDEKLEFNNMEYSEQIVILKSIVDRMFPELNRYNSLADNTFNEDYSVVQNRIQIYSIKHKHSDKYALIFHIVGDETYNDTYYFYDPKENIFEVANILKVYSEYIIVSDRFKTRIEEMEDMEEKKNKR